jgi:hypothetical protein
MVLLFVPEIHSFLPTSYGGIFESHSREYTLDDFHALQLDKMDRFLCLKKSEVVIGEDDESSSDDEEGQEDEDGDHEEGTDEEDEEETPAEVDAEVKGKVMVQTAEEAQLEKVHCIYLL